MTKEELIRRVAEEAEISKASAEKANNFKVGRGVCLPPPKSLSVSTYYISSFKENKKR